MKKRYQIGDLVKISSRFNLSQWRGHTALVKRIDADLLTLEILGPGAEVLCTFEDFIGERLANLRDFYTRPDLATIQVDSLTVDIKADRITITAGKSGTERKYTYNGNYLIYE